MKIISLHYEVEKEYDPKYKSHFFYIFKITRCRTFWRDLFRMNDLVLTEKLNISVSTSLEEAKKRLKKHLDPKMQEKTFERVAILDENGNDKLAAFE